MDEWEEPRAQGPLAVSQRTLAMNISKAVSAISASGSGGAKLATSLPNFDNVLAIVRMAD